MTIELRHTIFLSALAHLLLLLIFTFGLPQFFKPLPEPYQPIPFEIVDIAEITNTRTRAEPPAPPREKPPAEEEKAAPAPAQKEPEAPKPEEAQEEPPPPAEAPQKKPEPPKEKPKAQEKKADAFSSLLQNLAANKPAAPTQEVPDAKETAAPSASNAPALSDRLSITEEDLLRRQIQQCWNMPIGAPNPETLIVEVLITVRPDRTVQSAEIVDQARMGRDPFFRAAAEAAIRALYHPRCTPLMLPPDKYESWKNIRFNFDPREML